jgi:molybdopterin-guanine dinucleotide biosynthesis protein B
MRVIGLAGWSGAGKTTLMVKLIPCLNGRGIGVSTLKHAHHRFDVDVPGKDSWQHRQAGAQQVMVASGARWALMTELRSAAEPRLPELIARMDRVDLVIVEGFKRDAGSASRRQCQALDAPGHARHCRGGIRYATPL